MGHSGLTGRTQVRERNVVKHLKKGLCALCSQKREENKRYCPYHVEYFKKYNKKVVKK